MSYNVLDTGGDKERKVLQCTRFFHTQENRPGRPKPAIIGYWGKDERLAPSDGIIRHSEKTTSTTPDMTTVMNTHTNKVRVGCVQTLFRKKGPPLKKGRETKVLRWVKSEVLVFSDLGRARSGRGHTLYLGWLGFTSTGRVHSRSQKSSSTDEDLKINSVFKRT